MVVDRVAISPAGAFSRDVPSRDEVGDDAVGCAFGDPDGFSDLAQPYAGILSDTDQDARVARQEGPGGGSTLWHESQE